MPNNTGNNVMIYGLVSEDHYDGRWLDMNYFMGQTLPNDIKKVNSYTLEVILCREARDIGRPNNV